ncbi:MAG TPA: hypothetical protein VIG99_32860 [Myxococcaceae bacterium]
MPFTPDQPFPKTPGNPIMSKDWNDAIVEVQRLDTAKVNRTGADGMAGPLTINNALAVGTNVAAQAGTRLHVVDGANPTIARLQTTATNGAARLELWSDPRGSGTEWRPGYIESFDTGSYTGGLRFFTNGTGFGARLGFQEQLRLVNGVAGFGVTDPAYRIDTNGQIRVRQGLGGGGAGINLHQTAPNANRAFIGMLNDNAVGLMGLNGGGWGFQMDTTNGNVGIKTASTAAAALTVQGDVQMNTNAIVSGAATVSGQANLLGNTALGHSAPGFRLDVGGRARFRDGGGMAGFWFYNQASTSPQDRAFIGLMNESTLGLWGNTPGIWGLQMDTTNGAVTLQRGWTGNVHTEVVESFSHSTTSTNWVQIGNLSMTFNLLTLRTCWFNCNIGGVVQSGVTGNWSVGFRLLLDGATVIAYQEPLFNVVAGNGQTRQVDLCRFRSLAAGTHTVAAQWFVHGGTVLAGDFSSERVLQVVEL